MKKFIYYAVRILWLSPMTLAAIVGFYLFVMCFTYCYLVFALPVACIIVFKLIASYETDVEETMKLIHEIHKDSCD